MFVDACPIMFILSWQMTLSTVLCLIFEICTLAKFSADVRSPFLSWFYDPASEFRHASKQIVTVHPNLDQLQKAQKKRNQSFLALKSYKLETISCHLLFNPHLSSVTVSISCEETASEKTMEQTSMHLTIPHMLVILLVCWLPC